MNYNNYMEDETKIRDSNKATVTVNAYDRGYFVNSEGRVISPKGKIRKDGIDSKGYRAFSITFKRGDKIIKTKVSTHQLIAYQKFGAKALSEGILVRHKDGVATNNHPDNILIGTDLNNYHDRSTKLRKLDAVKISKTLRKLTDQQVFDLRSDRLNGMKLSDLHEKYSICAYTCNNILKGVTYRDLTKGQAIKKPLKQKPKKGPPQLPNLTKVQAFNLLVDRFNGMTLQQLHTKYPLSISGCSAIINGRTYKDVYRKFYKKSKTMSQKPA